MHRLRVSRASLLLAAVLLVADPAPAAAVLIQTASGTDNTTAPADDPGFGNVGYAFQGYGSAIYLGEGWVLTANHVGGAGVVLASGTFLTSGTGFSLMTGTNVADLYLYKLATAPVGLPTLPIAATASGSGTAVTMIGGGLDRGPAVEWTGFDGPYGGYGTLDTRSIRWGTNTVSATGLVVQETWGVGPNDYYLTAALTTVFDDERGTAEATEAQAVRYDSGGAVFTQVGGQWQLAGVMFAVMGYVGQPDPTRTALFGNMTFVADLSAYRSQIVAVIPEPSAAALACLAALTCGAWRMRRRRRGRPARSGLPG